MKKHYSLLSIIRIFYLFFVFLFSSQVKAQTYVFSGNAYNIAVNWPINKCGDDPTQTKWNGDASIYPSSGFNGGSGFGNINSVGWYCDGGSGSVGTSGQTYIPIKIWLKQTASTTLSATTWATAISGATLVYSGNVSTTIPVGSYDNITLCSSFNWTADNLEVLVETDWNQIPECGTAANWTYNTVANTHEDWFNNTSAASLQTMTGSVDQYRPDVQITIGAAGGSGPTANAGGNQTICQGQHATLNGSGTGSYSWSPSGTLSNPNISNPVATPTTTTTYTLTTSNACGTATDIATVTVSPLPTVNAGADATICSGQNTTLNGSGSGPYSWSPAGTLSNPNISNPVANPTTTTTYILSSTNGCGTVSDNAIVHVNNLPVANSGGDKTICAGKNVTLTASGGGTYSWNTGPTSPSITVNPTTTTIYTVTVTNSCGSTTATAAVNVNLLPTPNAGPDVTICNGQTATLSGSGGGTYVWSSATGLSCTSCQNPIASPTTPTTYTLTVTDANNCTATDPVVVDVNALPNPNITGTTNICIGQTTTLTASGGGTYVWNTGPTSASITVNPTINTTYTVTVTNANNCTKSANATINILATPTATITSASTICSGSSVTITAGGGGTYSWSTGASSASITVSPTTYSTYSVTVSNGTCSSMDTTSVAVNTSPSASISGNTNVCSGDAATLTASGGGTYVWNTGSSSSTITVSPTTTTPYTVTVTNASGCTATATVTVAVAPPPSALITGNNTMCSGSSDTLIASGGLTYVWNTAQTTSSIVVSPTTNATYSVLVSSGNCSSVATINVTVNPTPAAAINASSTTVCSGQTTTLTASGGGTYSWSTGSTGNPIIVTPTSASSYSVVVSNGMCTDTSLVNISINSGIVPDIFSSVSTICSGTNATLTANGGTNYIWNTGETTSSIIVSPTSATNYSVTVSNGACSKDTSIVVSVKASPTASVTATSNAICAGQNATLTASGGGTYVWSSGGQTTNTISVSPTSSASYTVIVTSANGCTASAISNVNVTPNPTAVISPNTTICSGQTTILTASGGTTYIWNPNGQTTNSIGVNPTAFTTYSVTVSNGSCTSTASTSVSVNPTPTANAGADVSINYGNSATLTATGGGTYIWSPGGQTDNIISVTPTVTTVYCVTVTNASGCTDSSCVTVKIDFNCGDLFIPNAFSPNNDGHNDFFVPRDICFKTFHFAVYDRWGVKVFETEDINTKGWDGSYRGETGNTAVFTYYFSYELVDGTSGEKKGTVTLLR